MVDSRPQWLAALRKLAASAVPEDVRDNPPVVPTFGTVRSLDPLRIALDSDPATTLPYAPACLDFPTFVGQRVWVQTYGRQVVVVGVSKASPDLPVGTGALWAGPVGKDPQMPWMLMEGQLLPRADYPELSALYGSTFPGSTTTYVALPDARGRTAVHREAGAPQFGTIGQHFGAKEHTLTTDQIPSHTHGPGTGATNFWGGDPSSGGSEGTWTPTNATKVAGVDRTGATGGGQPHNNIQPSLTLRYMVKVR